MIALLAPLLLAAAAAAGPIRGLNPELAAQYSGAGGTFTCLTAPHKTIPFAQVNDDFCDCPDGSDEPGARRRGSAKCFSDASAASASLRAFTHRAGCHAWLTVIESLDTASFHVRSQGRRPAQRAASTAGT
jgi:hypothetical protein